MNKELPLLEGERISLADDGDGTSTQLSDSQIEEKYVKGEVRIVTEQARYPLPQIPSMVESDDYQLNPEFQRRHRWSREKQSRLVESFIINVPIPPIFLYEDEFSHYEVMDGLQRLTAIFEFYRNRFELVDLTEWPELNGRTYKTLPEKIRRGIDRRYLSSIILLQETAKTHEDALRLKQMVFERINSGGDRLEYQESRNAIYDGPLNRLCIELARNLYLCRMWTIPEPSEDEKKGNAPSAEVLENEFYRKMEDVELVLRFFAYRQILVLKKGAQKEYFDLYLKKGNNFSKDVLRNLRQLFNDTVKLVWEIFGESAFWLYRKRMDDWLWYQRPTTALYDPLMYTVSGLLPQADELRERKDAIRDGMADFLKETYSKWEGRYTNRTNIEERRRLLLKYFSEHLSTR